MNILLSLLGVLRKLPLWVYPLAALIIWGWSGHHSAKVERKAKTEAQAQAAIAEDQSKQLKEQVNEIQRLTKERTDAAQRQAAQAAKDHAALAATTAAADRVLQRADSVVAAARAAATAASQSGGTPVDGLGRAFSSCVRSYQELGATALTAVREGKRCEAEYDALTKRGPSPKEKP